MKILKLDFDFWGPRGRGPLSLVVNPAMISSNIQSPTVLLKGVPLLCNSHICPGLIIKPSVPCSCVPHTQTSDYIISDFQIHYFWFCKLVFPFLKCIYYFIFDINVVPQNEIRNARRPSLCCLDDVR